MTAASKQKLPGPSGYSVCYGGLFVEHSENSSGVAGEELTREGCLAIVISRYLILINYHHINTVIPMDEMSQRLRDLETRVKALEDRLENEGAVSAVRGKKQSAKEFLLTKSIKAETHKVLA